MRWLVHAKHIAIDATVREADSERRRIEAMLNSLNHRPHLASIAKAYANMLTERFKRGKTTSRSIRLALRPAIALLDSLDTNSDLPKQADIDQYLSGAPGQRAALSGFVKFLNAQFGLSLVARTDPSKARQARMKLLERSLHALAHVSSDAPNNTWLAQALALFHGLPRNAVKNATLKHADYRSVPGIRVMLNSKSYWVPKPEGYLKLLNADDQTTALVFT